MRKIEEKGRQMKENIILMYFRASLIDDDVKTSIVVG